MLKQKFFVTVVLSLLLAGPAHAEDVTGFRSAHFGADEKAVTDAAIKDLGIKATDLQRTQDPVAKVTTLAAKVKSFEPLSLPASVTYVLGYKCNRLTQVSILWELPEGISVEQRKVAMSGLGALVSHLDERGWDKDEVIKNRVTGEVKEGGENTLLFFRGQHKNGNTVTLAGAPVKMMKSDADANKTGALTANIDSVKNFLLTYEKDGLKPDVYHIDVSGF